MSHHLGDQLSALVDGELDGAERDRVHAHLARCEPCRAEVADLRELKRRLRTLGTAAPGQAAMTGRLIALTGPGGPMPPRSGRRSRPASGRRAVRALTRPQPGRPGPSRRRRYLMLGTVSLVVGLSTVAFTVGGGGGAAPGPRITPPVEMYSVEHAITTGEVPFDPPATPAAPATTAGAATPAAPATAAARASAASLP
jgi:anti-sigma factor RsiW